MAVLADAERLVDVLAGLGPGVLQPLGDRLEALDLEADVMNAAPARAALHAGDRVVLEVEDRQVEVAVAQVVAPGARAVDLRDLLHAEPVDVELRGLVHVLGREGDVLDLRHGVSPVQVVRAGPGTCPGRLHGGSSKSQDYDSRSPAPHGGRSPPLDLIEKSPDIGQRGDQRERRDRRGASGCKSYRHVRSLSVARRGMLAMHCDPVTLAQTSTAIRSRDSRARALLSRNGGYAVRRASRGPRVEITDSRGGRSDEEGECSSGAGDDRH